MRSVNYLLIVLFISFAGCAKDELFDGNRFELSFNDYYSFIGMHEAEFRYIYASDITITQDSTGQLSTFLQGDSQHQKLDLCLKFENDICTKVSFTEISEEPELERFIMLGSLVDNKLKDPEILHIFYKKSGEHKLIGFDKLSELSNWLNTESTKSEIELKSISINYSYPNTDIKTLVCLNYTVREHGCNYGFFVLEEE